MEDRGQPKSAATLTSETGKGEEERERDTTLSTRSNSPSNFRRLSGCHNAETVEPRYNLELTHTEHNIQAMHSNNVY